MTCLCFTESGCGVQVQKLIEGSDYVFRVSAVNKEGTSKPLDSEAITPKSPFGNCTSCWYSGLYAMYIDNIFFASQILRTCYIKMHLTVLKTVNLPYKLYQE